MTLVNSFALIGAMFILAISPGPGVFATVSRAIASGFKNASFLVAGIVLGDIIFLLLAVYGLNIIASILGDLFVVIKYIGGIYLIYLGYKILTSSTEINHFEPKEKINIKENFLSGLFITLANPKVIIFYLGFLPAFINLEILSSFDILLIVVLVSSTLSLVLLSYAYSASKAKKFLKTKSAVKKLNITSGSVMIGAGTMLLLKD